MRIRTLSGLTAIGLSAGLFLACGDKGDDTGGSDGDDTGETSTDTDTDTDTTGTDTDTTDTDTDTDTTDTDTTDTDTDTDTDTTTAVEDCGDGTDNDDDGLADCDDPDCTDSCEEDCGDGVDNDADALVDCDDDECADACVEDCRDGSDNDGDDLIDCDDPDCAEADPCVADFYGELTWTSGLDGATDCDMDIQLIGGEYVGDCAGCDYAFVLDSSVVRDDGTDDCNIDPLYSMLGDDFYTPIYLAFWSSMEGYYGAMSNVLAVANGYYFYGYSYPGPYYWNVLAAEGETGEYGSFGTVGYAERSLTWELEDSYDYYRALYSDYCDYDYEYSDATAPATGTYTATGDMPCGGDYIDVYEFTADGGDLTISVDTVAEATAFDAHMWINGPDDCVAVTGDDNFECTFPPPSFSCPAWSGMLAGGDHQLVVASYSSCAGETAAYQVSIDAAADPGLTLIADDSERYETVDYSWKNMGGGRINVDPRSDDTGSTGGDTGSTEAE